MRTDPARSRLDKEAVFRIVGYQPHEVQRAIHASDAPRRVVACGVRFGKTTLAVQEALLALLEPAPSSRGWVVTPTGATTAVLTRQLFALLRTYFAHRVVELSEHRQRAVVRNLGGGLSEVVGRSADRPAALLGESLDWLVVDEAARVEDETWHEALATRLVDREGWALVTSTPRGEGGWFHEAFLAGERREAGFQAWTAPTWANPHVPRAAVDAERARMDDATFWTQLGGEFIGPGGRSCPTCGPAPEIPQQIVLLMEGQELASCQECGRPLGRGGESAGTRREDGGWDVAVIRIVPWVPEPTRAGGARDHGY